MEFLCGRRALGDYRAKNAMIMDLAREYTVGHWELADLVHRMAGELKESRPSCGMLRCPAGCGSDGSVASGRRLGPARVVQPICGRAPDDLKHLASDL